MTNILFAIVITLQTNVTVSDNSSGCREAKPNPPGVYYLDGHKFGHFGCPPFVPATEKYETIVITSITNAVHEHWKFELGRSEVSRVTKRWRNVPEKWVEAGTTNFPHSFWAVPLYGATNSFHRIGIPYNER